jgi:putative photosynthetic complex assembly protein
MHAATTQPTRPTFPRAALWGAAAAAMIAIGVAAIGRPDPTLTAPPEGVPMAARDITFRDQADGSVLVLDAHGKAAPIVLEPGTNAFVRATMRGLARERRLGSLGTEPPFRLAQWPNGRLTLSDTATGRQVDLVAFGPTQVEAFARLLHAEGAR